MSASFNAKEVEGFYYVEWHPSAGFKANALTFVHARNWLAMREGREVPWVVMGVFPDLESAQEMVHDLRRDWKCSQRGGG
jgi:hypothetical protein